MLSRTMLAGFFVFVMSGPLCAQKSELRPTITVTGSSDVQVVPDFVEFQVGFETRGRDLKLAFSEQEASVRQVLDLLQQSGIESRYVQTGHVEIQPVYDERAGRNLSYYDVRKVLGITLHEPAKYDQLLAALLQAGVNRVFGVNFRSSKQRQYRDQAREMAVSAAREKAAAIAQKLGQQIGPAIAVEEEDAPRVGYGMMPSNAIMEAPANQTDAGDSSLALGQITFRARVKISFGLK